MLPVRVGGGSGCQPSAYGLNCNCTRVCCAYVKGLMIHTTERQTRSGWVLVLIFLFPKFLTHTLMHRNIVVIKTVHKWNGSNVSSPALFLSRLHYFFIELQSQLRPTLIEPHLGVTHGLRSHLFLVATINSRIKPLNVTSLFPVTFAAPGRAQRLSPH